MKIELKNLKRYYGETKAVDGISFSFSSGQIFGFIGPNGAGKTTTMRILATLDEPTAGDATINGTSICQEPEKARRFVGYMPDSMPTHRDISVHDYLDFFARAYGIRGAKRRQVVETIEEFTKLEGLRDKMIRALSKGMKQRASLARALIHDPPMLVLDEPAAGLDPRARIELRELLKILSMQGKAILISSHILSELGEICDGAVIIEQGRILRAGTLEEIVARSESEATMTLIVRPLRDPEALHKVLLEMPHVENARLVAGEVEIDVAGDEERGCEILSELVRRGLQIAEFKQRRAHLEDVFMTVTKGDVQ